MERNRLRSRRWTGDPRARYWWHRLPGMDYVPPIYSDLAEEEWIIMQDWYDETDASGRIGECAVPLVSLLHGLIMGSRAERITASSGSSRACHRITFIPAAVSARSFLLSGIKKFMP